MNEAFHAVSAILLHLVSDVSIDVQREGCRGVTEVALHGFDVVAVLQGDHRVSVPQVVDPGLRTADCFCL